MKAFLGLLIALITLAAPSRAVGQNLRLAPTCAPGMHWQVNWDNTSRLRTMDTPIGVMNAPGFLQERGKAECTILDAADGQFKVMEIAFGKCEFQSQVAGATRATRADHPLDGRKIRVERHVNPDTREEKFDITAQGQALAPDVEDGIRDAFCVSLLPARPLNFGDQWKSERVDVILGPKAKGGMDLRLMHIENTAAGRRRAVVQVAGEATLEFAASGNGVIDTASLDMRYGFSGTMRIDLETGLVEGIDLTGPMRMEHGGNMGQPMVQRGDWTYRLEATRLAAVAVAPQPMAIEPVAAPVVAAPVGAGAAGAVAPGRNPLETGPDPCAGTFKDDQLVLELKPAGAGYAGSMRFAGKTFAVSAARAGNGLAGKFQSEAGEFPFTASFEADGTMKFISGRAAHALKKQVAVNPLEAAQPANPLEAPARKNPLAR